MDTGDVLAGRTDRAVALGACAQLKLHRAFTTGSCAGPRPLMKYSSADLRSAWQIMPAAHRKENTLSRSGNHLPSRMKMSALQQLQREHSEWLPRSAERYEEPPSCTVGESGASVWDQ